MANRGKSPGSQKALDENREKGWFNGETAVKAGEKSQKKQAEAKAEKKALSEILNFILDTPADDGLMKRYKMCEALVAGAMNGNSRDFEIIRDTIGEKPKETLELEGGVTFSFSGIGGDDISG